MRDGPLEGDEQLGRLAAVQGASQIAPGEVARIGADEEEWIGPLVAEQERLGLVTSAPDGLEGGAVDVFGEKFVGVYGGIFMLLPIVGVVRAPGRAAAAKCL